MNDSSGWRGQAPYALASILGLCVACASGFEPDSVSDDQDVADDDDDTAAEYELQLVTADSGLDPVQLLLIDLGEDVQRPLCAFEGPFESMAIHALAAADDGSLYAHDNDTGRLLSIDPCSCSIDIVGPTGHSSITALSFDDQGVLYGIDAAADALIVLSTTSGQATPLIPLALDLDDTGLTWSTQLQRLYVLNANDQTLWILDPTLLEPVEFEPLFELDHSFGTAALHHDEASGQLIGCTDHELGTIHLGDGTWSPLGAVDERSSGWTNLAAPSPPLDCLDD